MWIVNKYRFFYKRKNPFDRDFFEDSQQWLLFLDDSDQRFCLISARDEDENQRRTSMKIDFLRATDLRFLGANHFILTRADPNDEQNQLIECRRYI